MRHSILMMSAVGLVLLVSGSPASAQNVEELEKMVLALRMETLELFEKGREDEAHALEREAKGLLLKVRQLQSVKPDGDREKESDVPDPEMQYWKHRLQILRAAREQAEAGNTPEQELDKIREHISQAERNLAQLSESQNPRQKIPPQFQSQAENLENAARRLKHVRVAAENLKAAEMHDMAHELMKKAEGMEHEMQAAKMELAKLMHDSKGKDQGPTGELEQLRSENEHLRREMKELKEMIGQLRKETNE